MIIFVLRFIIFIVFLIFVNSCTTKTIYSGKIFNQDELEKINFVNKNNLLKELGEPSYIDPINKNFYYFSEKKEKRSIYNSKVKYSFVTYFQINI